MNKSTWTEWFKVRYCKYKVVTNAHSVRTRANWAIQVGGDTVQFS